MKKLIKKFWGVAFVVVLLSTLLVGAVPQASAGTLTYTLATSPDDIFGGIIATGITIWDYAVAGDGTTIYATTNAGVWKSLNAGRSWFPLNTGLGALPALVAVAPDNPNMAVFINRGAGTNNVSFTVDGGNTFLLDLGVVRSATNVVAANVTDVQIAKKATVAGRYGNVIAVTGAVGGAPALYCFNLAAFGGAWQNYIVDIPTINDHYVVGGATSFLTIKFSPNFDSDFVAYLVAKEAAGLAELHVISFNNFQMNSGVSGYNAYADAGTTINAAYATGVSRARIQFSPTFWAGEETLRVAYVALSTNSTANLGGVYRLTDIAGAVVSGNLLVLGGGTGTGIWSIAINADGTILVAAAGATNTITTITSPSTVFATATASRVIKRVGVSTATDNQVATYVGSTLLLSKGSTQGAFSMSTDNGFTFNDISLVNTALTNITDFVVKADGTQRYVVANNAAQTSVFFNNGAYWERTLVLPNANGYVAGASPANFDILYLGNKATATIYYTTTHGTVNWLLRTCPTPASVLVDLEVYDDSTLFVATTVAATGYVTKLTVTGLIWPNAPPYYNAVFGAGVNIASITLVGENKVIAGSAVGTVRYSLDGGATALSWIPIVPAITAGNVYTAATDLVAGSVIYAVTAADTSVYAWTIGSSTVWGLPAFTGPGVGTGFPSLSTGILIANGAVYRLGSDAGKTDVTLSRAFTSLAWAGVGWTSTNISAMAIYGGALPLSAVANVAPNVLKVSTAINTLWFTDVNPAPDRVITYTDTLVTAVPTLSAPSDAYLVQVNRETGLAYNVTLAWNPASLATNYQLQIGYDAAFTRLVVPTIAIAAIPGLVTNYVIGPQIGAQTAVGYQPGETFYWRVRASGPYFSGWSNVFSIAIQPAPAPVPELMSPINGETVNNLTPGFSWSSMSGQASASGITTTYTFELATDSAFSATSMVYTTTTTVAGLSLPSTVTLVDGTQYFWRVKTGTSVSGDWSTVANFVVNLAATSAPVTVVQTNLTLTSTATTVAHEDNVVNPSYIWAIIIIGAVLVIAVIVLIFRTRRVS